MRGSVHSIRSNSPATDFEAGVPETTDLVLVLHDALNPSIHQKAEEVFRPTGILGCEALFHLEKE